MVRITRLIGSFGRPYGFTGVKNERGIILDWRKYGWRQLYLTNYQKINQGSRIKGDHFD